MRKRNNIGVALLMAAVLSLLSGCGSLGIGSKNILRCVYLEQKEGLYQANLICLKSSPAADAAEAESSVVVLSGSGASVLEALQAADHSAPEELLYSLNELLLIGPDLAQEGLFETSEFLNAQQTGRPGTQVFLTDLAPEDLQTGQDAIAAMMDSVELLAGQSSLTSHLYQLRQEQGAVIPLLHLRHGNTLQAGSVVYGGDGSMHRWDDWQTQLAGILLRQSHRLRVTTEDGLTVLADSVKPGYEIIPGKEGMVLRLIINGHIREIQSTGGMHPVQQMFYDEKTINLWLEKQIVQMLEDSFCAQNDLFGFTAHLAMADAAETEQMKKHGTLYQKERVQVECHLEAI